MKIMTPGYAYALKRRHDPEPEIVIVSQADCDRAQHWSIDWIDGARVEIFMVREGRKPRYFAQLTQNCAPTPACFESR